MCFLTGNTCIPIISTRPTTARTSHHHSGYSTWWLIILTIRRHHLKSNIRQAMKRYFQAATRGHPSGKAGCEYFLP